MDNTHFISQVEQAIIDCLLAGADARIEVVAECMVLSPRTLQRKLKRAGTSHRTLLGDARLRVAAVMLRQNKHLSQSRIALALGYSSPTAFNRAFRRWTGKAPGQAIPERGPRAEATSHAA